MATIIELPTTFPRTTARQRQVLRSIHGFILEKRCYPSNKELGERLGLTEEGARIHVDALIRKGFLTRSAGWRNLQINEFGLQYLALLVE